MRRLHHVEALFGGMRHGLLAVDILAGIAGIHDHAFVPVVGHGRHDAIDILAVEQLLIMTRGGQAGIIGDLPGEGVAAIIEVGCGDTFDAGQANGGGEQTGALHADSDHAKTYTVAGGHGSGSTEGRRFERHGIGGK